MLASCKPLSSAPVTEPAGEPAYMPSPRLVSPANPRVSNSGELQGRTVQPVASNGGAPFSALELLVIGIGEKDPPAVLTPGGRMARMLRLLFGIEAPAPFADARLEALRSLAGALRHRRRNPDAQIIAALAAGITMQQVERLKARG